MADQTLAPSAHPAAEHEPAPRAIYRTIEPPADHWVGDGFPARTYLSPHDDLVDRLSPFLLLDYGGAYEFAPTERRRGVGGHPHRGFETVTVVWDGAIAHHDSNGNTGVVGPGDVQWMTAASGVLHAEYHETEFARAGGVLDGAQIWVDLPAQHKMDPPRYQAIAAAGIPTVDLADGQGWVRVIAGSFDGTAGPARTFSPVDLWDLHLHEGGRLDVSFPEDSNVAVLVADGDIRINGVVAQDGTLVVFDNRGRDIVLEAATDAHVLVLAGEPLGQPVVAHGPFVMNSVEEIDQAIADFQAGAFGHLPR